MLCLLMAEPEVPKHVARRGRHSDLHGESRLLTPSGLGVLPPTRTTVYGQGPRLVLRSSGCVSRTREARRAPLQTWRRTGSDVRGLYGVGFPGPLARQQPWAA